MSDELLCGVQVIEPVSSFISVALQKHAAVVITDSGCIQEEAYLLKVPCITIRDNTERHLTVSNGANVVTGFVPVVIKSAIRAALNLNEKEWPNIYGAPGAGTRIVNQIVEYEGEKHHEADLLSA